MCVWSEYFVFNLMANKIYWIKFQSHIIASSNLKVLPYHHHHHTTTRVKTHIIHRQNTTRKNGEKPWNIFAHQQANIITFSFEPENWICFQHQNTQTFFDLIFNLHPVFHPSLFHCLCTQCIYYCRKIYSAGGFTGFSSFW